MKEYLVTIPATTFMVEAENEDEAREFFWDILPENVGSGDLEVEDKE